MKYTSSETIQLRRVIPVVVAVVLVLAVAEVLVHWLTESWWFTSVGFQTVFWTRIRWQMGMGILVFLGYAIFLGSNYHLALWVTRDRTYRSWQRANGKPFSFLTGQFPHYLAIAVIALLSLAGATGAAAAWETLLKFLNPTPFNINDPIFQQDVSFYLFRLPFYQGILAGGLRLLTWGTLLSAAIYALKGEIRPERGWKYFLTGDAKTHLCVLLAAISGLIALDFWLSRYELLYSPTGVVFGAGYTDAHARLQAYWLMGWVTLGVAGLFVLSLWRSGFSLPTMGVLIYLGLLVMVSGIYPWIQQKLVVEPNELEKEKPYILHNIDFTRQAYDLNQVVTEPFPAVNQLDQRAIQENQDTIANIRLWDYRPLLSTYRQLQEIRLYYLFHDVDNDRYTLNGNYRQVMLSARELAYEQVPREAQTWVNQRLKFTHGFGLVMSPVNQVTPDGLPELFVKNIPPVATVDLPLEETRIYYGEKTADYIFTGTATEEFDYPLQDENATFRYTGQGGVPMGSFLRRLAYAFDLGSIKVLFSNYFTADTRIHYYRTVLERIHHVAPFLTLDSDPYIAVIDGRLQWIVDAYTVSDRYPYATPLSRGPDIQELPQSPTLTQLIQQDANYVQDAVKVVVDAYDGTLRFYALNEQDPVLATYGKIFPQLFLPLAEMPTAIQAHLRYPRDFFTLQAQMYRAYHMANPEVFYNREDLWRFPTQVYEGQQVLMEPYYLILSLPGFDGPEFVQIMPFTPANKDNMVAWMAGRSDGEDYGKLFLYEFPKQELVYGPSQIEARIDQTPEISEQITLWSQQGSRVIRGDLLVIPVEQSLLYVEPLFLRAEQGELPELRRVIVAYGNQIVMRETLEACLDAIFGEGTTAIAPAPSRPPSPTPAPLPTDVRELVQAALDAYGASQTALEQGDWQRYGEAQRKLGEILQQLNQSQPAPPPAP